MNDAPKCPKCQRVLMSRFSKLCNFCGEKIPEALLFTPDQKAAIESDEKKTQERLAAAEAERLAEQAARFSARTGAPVGGALDEILREKLKQWENDGWPEKRG